MIPKQLKHLSFCRIKRGTKIPFELDWTNKPYSYEEISKFFPEENYGVICGYNDLAVIDCDNESFSLSVDAVLPETFTVKTGSGGTHFYYFIPNLKKKIVIMLDNQHLGEIQSYGTQVVGPGSIHPNGNEYEVLKNVGIQTISLTDLEKSGIGQFLKKEDRLFENKQSVEDFRGLIEESIKAWKEGDRQNLALSLSGYLRKEKGLGIIKVKNIIKEICERTEDNELEMRLRAVDETFKKDESQVKGYSGLRNIDLIKAEESQQNLLKILWDKDLMNYQEKESNWLVENLIKVGSINVLGGKRSTLKSWVSEIMGYSVANGIDFLGKFKTKKGRVLCLDRENQFSELKIRSKLIKNGLGLKDNSDIAFLSESYIKIDNPLDIERLENIIQENEISLLIVDVYRRVISFDENDAKEVSNLFTELLKPLTERTGVTILLIHHEKKGESSGDEMDMLRGSSDLANYVDGIIQVERKGDTLTIKQNKSRGSKEIEPFQVKVETNEIDYFKLTYKGLLETTSTYISKQIVKWAQFENKRDFTYTDVIKHCEREGYKKTSIVSALAELQNKGIITKGNTTRSPYTITKDLVGGDWV